MFFKKIQDQYSSCKDGDVTLVCELLFLNSFGSQLLPALLCTLNGIILYKVVY